MRFTLGFAYIAKSAIDPSALSDKLCSSVHAGCCLGVHGQAGNSYRTYSASSFQHPPVRLGPMSAFLPRRHPCSLVHIAWTLR